MTNFCLCNYYEKGIFLWRSNTGPINNLHYADNTVIIADNCQSIQVFIDEMNQNSAVSKLYRKYINIGKTKSIIISKIHHTDTELWILVQTNYRDPQSEIKCRIDHAEQCFNKIRSLLYNNNLSFQLWGLYFCVETRTLKVTFVIKFKHSKCGSYIEWLRYYRLIGL